jgi:hypothetical protein
MFVALMKMLIRTLLTIVLVKACSSAIDNTTYNCSDGSSKCRFNTRSSNQPTIAIVASFHIRIMVKFSSGNSMITNCGYVDIVLAAIDDSIAIVHVDCIGCLAK